ncbi:NAD(P)-dependent oxidoreductase [Pontibacter diazotrophicus]|uniref:NAD(P)-dependent oxidoreductase n=1 Tax=Pontibacter diazotrophicus TaxID=1400979 RepID=A0A3D8LG15_9BACT|nr:NAD(P)-dependent oxidoreductase [Pontibacter diazotrophicus]RDV16266.1 NAD(P)-dependent oxidoreductase [Pontibacter diazotrophicus]
MKIAIIGASGNIGSRITQEALTRGHDVTAIVRHPEKVAKESVSLEVKQGDVEDVEQTAALIKGHDALVVSHSPGWGPDTDFHKYVEVAEKVLQAAKKAGVKRVLNVGGAGSLYTEGGVQLVDTPDFPEAWKGGALAQRDSLKVYQEEQELDWTFFSPAIIIEPGERTGKFRYDTENPVTNERGESKISRQDFAVAVLDELEDPQFIRQRFTIGY